MGLIPVLSVIFFSALTILLLPFAQMSLYVADRQFFIADVAANLYRWARHMAGNQCPQACRIVHIVLQTAVAALHQPHVAGTILILSLHTSW